MWFPSPVYERLPQFWLLLGLMFFAFGLYLGFDYQLIFAYVAIGVACISRSVWTFRVRAKYRSKPNLAAPVTQSEPPRSEPSIPASGELG